ncbi:MAG: leucyl aminopeptidase [Rhodospirillales bacterium 20-60-12]|nr:MAG: leucyl aminopeptidase [Rhodospirillales bacterium 20-60-12]
MTANHRVVRPLAGLAAPDTASLPLYALRPDGLADFIAKADPVQAKFLQAQEFAAKPGTLILLPGPAGLAAAVLGLGDDRSPFAFGALARRLPPGTIWRLEPGDYDPQAASLGFYLGAYAFDQLKSAQGRANRPACLIPPADAAQAVTMAESICFGRDLINMPANLLGPSELADAVMALADEFGALAERITGDALTQSYPCLAAVGAGSDRPPVMVKFSWGNDKNAPLISLCGKGVCFDTGGYDLKPSSAMLRMKKDMGGAAIALGLARLIMATGLNLRLEVRIGCVENSISGHAMRPLDVLQTRVGLTVEVGNTDAEGRLVLADLLADAAESKPDWLINFATLTGAARVALGPDLPALFSNDDVLANNILQAGESEYDPLWRLPLWRDYGHWLDSPIADMNNVSSKPHAGAIVAALFLQRFVPAATRWAHIDVYAWNDQTRTGRPEGGEVQSLRAVFRAISLITSKTR